MPPRTTPGRVTLAGVDPRRLAQLAFDLESQEIGKEFHAKLRGIFEFGGASARVMIRLLRQGFIARGRNRRIFDTKSAKVVLKFFCNALAYQYIIM
jgi:hypothetical protein